MTTPIIRTVTASDEAPSIAAVVLAFSADPAVRWTWPDPQQYLMHFPSLVRALGGNAFSQKSAYYVDAYTGAALMKHALIPCDRDQTLAYLESSNPKNVPLYERHGFELLGTIQVGTSPPLFPMLRKPRKTQPTSP